MWWSLSLWPVGGSGKADGGEDAAAQHHGVEDIDDVDFGEVGDDLDPWLIGVGGAGVKLGLCTGFAGCDWGGECAEADNSADFGVGDAVLPGAVPDLDPTP